MMKNMMTSPDMLAAEHVKVITDTSKVACVYCGGGGDGFIFLKISHKILFLLTI